jgi:hypothetical protein
MSISSVRDFGQRDQELRGEHALLARGLRATVTAHTTTTISVNTSNKSETPDVAGVDTGGVKIALADESMHSVDIENIAQN